MIQVFLHFFPRLHLLPNIAILNYYKENSGQEKETPMGLMGNENCSQLSQKQRTAMVKVEECVIGPKQSLEESNSSEFEPKVW